MRKISIFFFLSVLGSSIFGFSACKKAQEKKEDINQTGYYAADNKGLMAQPVPENRVVFIGNSIVQDWYKAMPGFFDENNFVNRGISEQLTSQIAGRLDCDVVDIKAKVVVIAGGINDIRAGREPYSEDSTFSNLTKIATQAREKGVLPIMVSVLPCSRIPGKPEMTDVAEKIISLNKRVQAFAQSNGIAYVDYHSALRDEKGGLLSEYTTDGIHITPEGYLAMSELVKIEIDSALKVK